MLRSLFVGLALVSSAPVLAADLPETHRPTNSPPTQQYVGPYGSKPGFIGVFSQAAVVKCYRRALGVKFENRLSVETACLHQEMLKESKQ